MNPVTNLGGPKAVLITNANLTTGEKDLIKTSLSRHFGDASKVISSTLFKGVIRNVMKDLRLQCKLVDFDTILDEYFAREDSGRSGYVNYNGCYQTICGLYNRECLVRL